ncbi:MAG: hypothetical protein JW786_09985 [Desulfobacterales bacterium]|nr:hypothetical protein [Desulfobacterales bacterium]
MTKQIENCQICGCIVHRTKNTYARPNVLGRSHASRHHYVPERFFGRSSNRKGTQREQIFDSCPWGHEREYAVFCYDCHEELLHNPILLPEDIERLSKIVEARGIGETNKTDSLNKLAERIKLFHEVIDRGLKEIEKEKPTSNSTGPAKSAGQ